MSCERVSRQCFASPCLRFDSPQLGRSSPRLCLPQLSRLAMQVVTTTMHRNGLAPLEAVRAYVKNREQDMSLDEIIAEGDILNYQ